MPITINNNNNNNQPCSKTTAALNKNIYFCKDSHQPLHPIDYCGKAVWRVFRWQPVLPLKPLSSFALEFTYMAPPFPFYHSMSIMDYHPLCHSHNDFFRESFHVLHFSVTLIMFIYAVQCRASSLLDSVVGWTAQWLSMWMLELNCLCSSPAPCHSCATLDNSVGLPERGPFHFWSKNDKMLNSQNPQKYKINVYGKCLCVWYLVDTLKVLMFVWDKVLVCGQDRLGIYYLAQTGFELAMFLPAHPECWDHKCKAPHLARYTFISPKKPCHRWWSCSLLQVSS